MGAGFFDKRRHAPLVIEAAIAAQDSFPLKRIDRRRLLLLRFLANFFNREFRTSTSDLDFSLVVECLVTVFNLSVHVAYQHSTKSLNI